MAAADRPARQPLRRLGCCFRNKAAAIRSIGSIRNRRKLTPMALLAMISSGDDGMVLEEHLREASSWLAAHWCDVTAIVAPLVAAVFVFIRMSRKANPEQRLWRIAGEQAEAEMISRYLAGGEPIDADFDDEQLRKYALLLKKGSLGER